MFDIFKTEVVNQMLDDLTYIRNSMKLRPSSDFNKSLGKVIESNK